MNRKVMQLLRGLFSALAQRHRRKREPRRSASSSQTSVEAAKHKHSVR